MDDEEELQFVEKGLQELEEDGSARTLFAAGQPTSVEGGTPTLSARMATVLRRGLHADACMQGRSRASDTGQQQG
jgi:hypothetical protein